MSSVMDDWFGIELNKPIPEAEKEPPPVEEVDVDAQKKLARKRLTERNGRRSTILGSKLGTSGTTAKKTELG